MDKPFLLQQLLMAQKLVMFDVAVVKSIYTGCISLPDNGIDKTEYPLGACPRTATDLRESRFESVFAVFFGEYRYI
jgi:hypothetical protein